MTGRFFIGTAWKESNIFFYDSITCQSITIEGKNASRLDITVAIAQLGVFKVLPLIRKQIFLKLGLTLYMSFFVHLKFLKCYIIVQGWVQTS